MKADIVYHNLLNKILFQGVKKEDRTGTGTLSIFGESIKFDLREGFPLLTTKKVHTRSIVHELLWFLSGNTNIKYLIDNGVTIWTEWAYERYLKHCRTMVEPDTDILTERDGRLVPCTMSEFEDAIKLDYKFPHLQNQVSFASEFGDLGPVYGKQWRDFNGIDQVSEMIETLRKNPDSRRTIVSAWNPGEIADMALPPCHALWQIETSVMSLMERKKYWCDQIGKSIYYAEDFDHIDLDKREVPRRWLNLLWYQRSVDTFLGLPFNIASYAILTHMIAQQVNMAPKELTGFLGDTHIYTNHIEQVKKQLSRDPLEHKSPIIRLNRAADIFSYSFEDIKIEGYESFPGIKAPIAV